MHSKALLLAFVFAALSAAHPLSLESPSNNTVISTVNSTHPHPQAPAPARARVHNSRHLANLGKLLVQNRKRRPSAPFNETAPVDPTAAASRGAGRAQNATMPHPHLPRRKVDLPSTVHGFAPRSPNVTDPHPSLNGTEEIPDEAEDEEAEEEEKSLDKRDHNEDEEMDTPPFIFSNHSQTREEHPEDSGNQTHSSSPLPHLPRANMNISAPAVIQNRPLGDGTGGSYGKADHGDAPFITNNTHAIRREDEESSHNNTTPQFPVRPPVSSHGTGGSMVPRSDEQEMPFDELHQEVGAHGH
ncbi:hypothetical protein FRC17_009428 [Serendipita sp. 399]|nr:hypothetical protein FRC17_009428 [Serendipita sp. 399]